MLLEKRELMGKIELCNEGKMLAFKPKAINSIKEYGLLSSYVDKKFASLKDSIALLSPEYKDCYANFQSALKNNKLVCVTSGDALAKTREFLINKYKDSEIYGIMGFINLLCQNNKVKDFKIPIFANYVATIEFAENGDRTLIISENKYSMMGLLQSTLILDRIKLKGLFLDLNNDKFKPENKEKLINLDIALKLGAGTNLKERLEGLKNEIAELPNTIKAELKEFLDMQIMDGNISIERMEELEPEL